MGLWPRRESGSVTVHRKKERWRSIWAISFPARTIGSIHQTAACAWQLTADKQKEQKKCIKGLLLKGLTSNSIPSQLGSEYIQSKVSLQCCVCHPSILQRLQKTEKQQQQQQRFDKALNKAASLWKLLNAKRSEFWSELEATSSATPLHSLPPSLPPRQLLMKTPIKVPQWLTVYCFYVFKIPVNLKRPSFVLISSVQRVSRHLQRHRLRLCLAYIRTLWCSLVVRRAQLTGSARGLFSCGSVLLKYRVLVIQRKVKKLNFTS